MIKFQLNRYTLNHSESNSARICHRTALNWSNTLIQMIQLQRHKEWSRWLREFSVVHIDAVEDLYGKLSTQEEFVAWIESVSSRGGQVLLSANRMPTTREVEPIFKYIRDELE